MTMPRCHNSPVTIYQNNSPASSQIPRRQADELGVHCFCRRRELGSRRDAKSELKSSLRERLLSLCAMFHLSVGRSFRGVIEGQFRDS